MPEESKAYTHPNPMYNLNADGTPVYSEIMGVSTVYGVESQILRGTMSFSKSKLQELAPSYTGYTHVFVTRVPPILTAPARGDQIDGYESDQKTKALAHCRNLRALFEMGCTSYSGTPDLTVNTSEVSIGWSDRSYPAPTTAAYDAKQFTLKVLETRGEPLRRGIEYYVSGMTDPNVKAALLNGATFDASKKKLMEPTLYNFTWSFMIIQTDQTLLRIQDISMWNSCIITGIDRSNLDWENGTVDIVQPRDVQFAGMYMPHSENPILEKYALQLLGSRLKFYKRYRDMNEEDIGKPGWQDPGTDFST
ncbi:MAG: hypothetical protein K2F99_06425 [Muribaculaceae bacterium]|nr:hypothetical protein [Muribaculaceae bacterium]